MVSTGAIGSSNTNNQVYTSSSGSYWGKSNLELSEATITGKLMVNGFDVSSTLATICERLTILVPDPKKIEKYDALRQAYEHYKLLEALLTESDGEQK
jgi:hypothetical protein